MYCFAMVHFLKDSNGFSIPVFTLGHNSYGQCGRSIVENEVYRGNETINKIDVDFDIQQVREIFRWFLKVFTSIPLNFRGTDSKIDTQQKINIYAQIFYAK